MKKMSKHELIEEFNGTQIYFSVEPNHNNPKDGVGKNDAVLFEAGNKGGDIDNVVEVSTEQARQFAESILKVCDAIENDEGNKTTQQFEQPNRELYIKVDDEVLQIEDSLRILNGQLHFFSCLFDEIDVHRDAAAMFIKDGIIQDRLRAIYVAFNDQLREISKATSDLQAVLKENLDTKNP